MLAFLIIFVIFCFAMIPILFGLSFVLFVINQVHIHRTGRALFEKKDK